MNDNQGKILVALTGGTIGSACVDGVRGLSGDSPYILIREFRRAFPEYAGCRLDVINPCSILSENLTCEVWNVLYKALRSVDIGSYDGIIVTHGSDTLAYTAAATGMLLRDIDCPVVLTAADRPVDDPASNALPNFRAAVDFILGGGLRGVFVSYRRNADGAQTIYLATRLLSADCFCDEFSSYGGGCFGIMKDGRFIPEESTVNPSPDSVNSRLQPIAGEDIDLRANRIMILRSYPGMDYSAINPEGFAAVVNYGYHCATACVEGENTSILRFAEKCREAGVKLWLGSFKRAEGEIYSTQTENSRAGIGSIYDMSPEAAYVKAVLAYNLPIGSPEAFMENCIYFEMPEGTNAEVQQW